MLQSLTCPRTCLQEGGVGGGSGDLTLCCHVLVLPSVFALNQSYCLLMFNGYQACHHYYCYVLLLFIIVIFITIIIICKESPGFNVMVRLLMT